MPEKAAKESVREAKKSRVLYTSTTSGKSYSRKNSKQPPTQKETLK